MSICWIDQDKHTEKGEHAVPGSLSFFAYIRLFRALLVPEIHVLLPVVGEDAVRT